MEEDIKSMTKEELLEYLESISKQLDNIALDQISIAISELQFLKGQLEEENKNKTLKNIEYEKTLEKLQKETIWKSKVKEKIEEIEQEDLEIYDTDSEDLVVAKYEYRAVLDALQELLREE